MILGDEKNLVKKEADEPASSSSNDFDMSGYIAFLAQHRTAANLIMIILIICGVWGIIKMNSQFLPTFGIDVVSVVVEWPGANAENVDENIVQVIEPEVRFLDAVKRVRSTSYDGVARVFVEFETDSNMQKALSDIESAVTRLSTLPENSKKPEVQRIVRYDTIARVVLSGNIPEASLKIFAKKIRDDLLSRGVDKVTLFGSRNEEFLVEVRETDLRRLDYTLAQVANKIGVASLDLPSGDIGDGFRQVQSEGLVKNTRDLGKVEIMSAFDGNKIFLSDIADIRESFHENAATGLRNGFPAIELHLQRALNSDALELADTVKNYLDEITGAFPQNLEIEQYDFATDLLDERINLLVKNGLSGLIVVGLILFLFLNASVAIWVLIGIPISFLAALGVMYAMGQTINMISLFGLIMALGIVVDDAIVVGEHAESRRRMGLDPLYASIVGARRMASPVICASLTTICAFLPLMLISGIIGQIISAIPLVIIAVLVASLIECFYVLPGHLYHGMANARSYSSVYDKFRSGFEKRFDKFRTVTFKNIVSLSIHWRYMTITITITLLILSIGLLVGGRVNFNFFPTPEADKIFANVKMVAGTSRMQTVKMLNELERAAYSVVKTTNSLDEKLIQMTSIKIGSSVLSGSSSPSSTSVSNDSIGGLTLELLTADKRSIRAPHFIKLWRQNINVLPGLKTLTIQQARGGPPGRDVDIRLLGTEIGLLKVAASQIMELLKRYPGVSDVEDNIPFGKSEIGLSVTPKGKSLGFTTKNVGSQVRNALEGIIASRFSKSDEEVVVRVRYPSKEMTASILNTLHLRTPNGGEVPLRDAVELSEKVGFSQVKREDGKRQISITADLNTQITSTSKIIAALQRDKINDIVADFGLELIFAGKAEERNETFADMRFGFIIGMFGIYIVLAWVFSSYSRPLVIMAMIPMGFIGAVIGHWVLGYNLTILSLIGLIGLSGIVINGSIILVTTVEERLKSQSFLNSIISASCDRLRPIILTSATTIGGLLPLIFEKSLQAQFLIPMAITIIFGLGVASVLVLFVVPALLTIIEDFRVFRAKAERQS